jgi:four helix bundle protein
MATWKKFEDIEAWQESRVLCKKIFELFQKEPANRDFSLKDQMFRASGSIMDNIAEGFERDGRKEFIQFLSYSKASSGEVISQLYRCLDRKYLSTNEFENLKEETEKIGNKIGGLMRYLKNSNIKGSKFNY